MFPTQIAKYCGNLSKIVEVTLFNTDYPIQNTEYPLKEYPLTYYHFVFLRAILRRSEMLLTFSRRQIMYNVSYVVLSAEVTYQVHFVIQ